MKFDVLRISYRGGNMVCKQAISVATMEARKAGHDIQALEHGHALLHWSRNQAIGLRRPDVDGVLMIDDDMLPQPDAINKLMETDQPVVTALCTTRIPPLRIATKVYLPERDTFAHIDKLNLGTVTLGQFGVGGAFLFIRRDAIEELEEYCLSGREWLDMYRPMFDRMHVRAEVREKERQRVEALRRDMYSNKKECRLFSYDVDDNQLENGEDISFSRKLIHLKIPVAIDTRVIVGHMGDYAYDYWDYLEQQKRALNCEAPIEFVA